MITILMPVYNGIEFIHESINSIMIQTMEDWELIVGINGHPENSDVYTNAKSFEYLSNKIRVYDLYTIKGKSEALNEMVKYAKYDHVAILDVDDIWYPEKLEKQLPYIKEGYDVVGTKCVYFGSNSNVNGVVPKIPTDDISTFDFLLFNPMINSSAIIKKKHANWICEYGVEDYELWLYLRNIGKRFFNCNEILVKHRIHEASAFNSKGNSNRVPELQEKYSFLRNS